MLIFLPVTVARAASPAAEELAYLRPSNSTVPSTSSLASRRAGLTRVCLGEGKNGMVRYLREEVIAYEDSRRVQLVP